MKNYTINKIIPADSYVIRKAILRPHQTSDQVNFELDDHANSFHLGVFDDSTLIGVVSILYDGPTQFRLRGMAIIKDYQRQGVGKQLINEAISLIPTNKLLWCNARTHALKFYQDFGFMEFGKAFDIEHTGPHIRMQLKL